MKNNNSGNKPPLRNSGLKSTTHVQHRNGETLRRGEDTASAVQIERDRSAALINSITDEIWFADKEGRITLVNSAVLKEFGINIGDKLKIEKVFGNLEVYCNDGTPRPVNEAPLLRALRGEIITNEEEMIRSSATRELIYRQVNAAPVYNPDGSIIGSVAVVRDLNRRWLNEKMIEYNEERYRVLSEAATELLSAQDIQKGIDNICRIVMKFLHCQVFFNFLVAPGLSKLHLNAFQGISQMEAQKIEWLDFGVAVCGCVAHDGRRIIAENIQVSEDALTAIIKSYGIRAYCCHPLKSGDKVIGTLSFGTRERDSWSASEISTMETVSGLVSVAILRKRLEEELIRNREKLEHAKLKLELALENANIGLWEYNVKTNDVFMDERTQAMLGLRPGSSGRTYKRLEKFVFKEDIDHIRNAIINTMQNDLPFETIFRTKQVSGKQRYISAKALVSKDVNGEVESLAGVAFDITELKQGTELLISKLNMDLLRSNSDLQQFAYVASHDLQEPLRMISSFSQLLQINYAEKLDKKANEYINFAVDGSKRMYELLNGLLSFSRIKTRGTGFKEISMETVVQKVKGNLRLLIDETGTEISNGQLPRVNADEIQMIQLIQNLVDNSIKFCRKKPLIHISSRRGAGMYTFCVQDNGIGIESQYFDKIFRIFQRLHLRGEYKGTGIGLAISRSIVERHGGKIWVESSPGKGSAFFFSIPIHPSGEEIF